MAIDTIKSTAVLDGAIATADIADDAVTNAKIGAGAVGTTEVADDAITGAKIENNPTIAGTLTSTGLITASAGVAIGGTGAANTLDDYEEGSWTPTLTGYSGGNTQTYQYQTGKYTRVGRLVTCTYQLRLSAKGNISGNYVHLKGMPFANESTIAGSGIIHYVWAIGTTRDNLHWEIGGGNTDRGWLTYLDGTTTQYVTTSDIGNTTGFMGTVVYFTDA